MHNAFARVQTHCYYFYINVCTIHMNIFTLQINLLCEHKAVIIQKWVRGWLARTYYRRSIHAIIYLQCCFRRMMAKRELRKLKIEARSVERYKKLHIGMENKIMQLQRKVDEQVCFEQQP